MKLHDKVLLIVSFLMCFSGAQTIHNPIKISKEEIPHKLFKGDIVDGLKWNDKEGSHIIIVVQYKKGKSFEKGWISELYAHKFTVVADSFKQDWKIQEFTPANQAEVRYIDSTLVLFDVNNDSIAESRFFYAFNIDGLEPLQIKDMFHFRNTKLAIRGKVPIEIDPSEIDSSGYEKQMDKAFDTVPQNIRDFASKDWDTFVHKKFDIFRKN